MTAPDVAAGGPAISGERLLARWERIWEAMEDRRLDGLIVAGRGMITLYGYLEYVTGYTPVVRSGFAVFAQHRAPVLVVSTPADAHLANRAGLVEARAVGEGDVVGGSDNLSGAIATVLAEHGVVGGTVGVVGLDGIVTVGEHRELAGRLAPVGLVDATALLAEIKTLKDDEDLRGMAAAAAVADAGFRVFQERIRPGATGWELQGEVERAVRALGARDTLLFVSAGPYFLHPPGPERFTEGDLVTAYVELVSATGCWVEKAGTFAVGEVSAERRALADACLGAARDAEELLCVGRQVSQIAEAIEARAAAVGARSGIWHGHGVGIDHDLPVISRGEQRALTAGLVLSVHPNFSDASECFGASAADTYVVAGEGPARRLSQIPQQIFTVASA
jgi:Xaa-Pro aminopeptidase